MNIIFNALLLLTAPTLVAFCTMLVVAFNVMLLDCAEYAAKSISTIAHKTLRKIRHNK